jgi:hypothetical protein
MGHDKKGQIMSNEHPSFGFRTLKGFGSRLVRGITVDANGKNDADDWHNYMVKEGTSGWKKGLSFERAYAYQPRSKTSEAHHLYRMIVTRQQSLDVLCIAFGRTSDVAWRNAYTMLHEKGVMPDDAYEAAISENKSNDDAAA